MMVRLIKNIKFTSFCGKQVVLSEGTTVFVDLNSMVAYTNNVHFDVLVTEFAAYQ